MTKFSRCISGLLAAGMILNTAGCSKKPQEYVPNGNRSAEHSYDFVDFIDIKAYGPDGKGIMEVTPREYTVADFDTEQEYIAIKNLMDDLNLVYRQGEDNRKSNIMISKTEDLKNGDIVQIGIDTRKWNKDAGIDINLEAYDFVVDQLTVGSSIDLFNDESVIVYGLSGTNNVFTLKTPKTATFPKEIEDNIVYSVATEEKNLVPGVSIANISATMEESFLMNPDNPYYNIDIYLKKHGYDYVSKTQTVLDQVIEPIRFGENINASVEDYLTQQFVGKTVETWSRSYVIDRIGNIQQQKNREGIDRYNYTVTFHAVSANEEETYEDAFRNTMYLWIIGNQIVMTEVTPFTLANEISVIENPVNDDMDVLAQFYYAQEDTEDVPPEGNEGDGNGN